MKYVKVMFGNKGANFEYKIGEINIATIWNPKAEKGRTLVVLIMLMKIVF